MCNNYRTKLRPWKTSLRSPANRPKSDSNFKKSNMLTTYNYKNSYANKMTNTTQARKPNPTSIPTTKPFHQIRIYQKSNGSPPNINLLNSKNNTRKLIKKFNYFHDKETRNSSHFKKTNSNSRKDSKSPNN